MFERIINYKFDNVQEILAEHELEYGWSSTLIVGVYKTKKNEKGESSYRVIQAMYKDGDYLEDVSICILGRSSDESMALDLAKTKFDQLVEIYC